MTSRCVGFPCTLLRLALLLGSLLSASCARTAYPAIVSMMYCYMHGVLTLPDWYHVWTAEWGGNVAGVPVPW